MATASSKAMTESSIFSRPAPPVQDPEARSPQPDPIFNLCLFSLIFLLIRF